LVTRTNGGGISSPQRDFGTGDYKAMATNPSPVSDVLHSENHSKLSTEEIAKALARHNKHHPKAGAEASQKPVKGGKK
jgi:hypothetical protein